MAWYFHGQSMAPDKTSATDNQPIPARELSDGQLAFLGFVAMFRLRPAASLLALDEPEAHFHPGLLARVMGLLSTMTEDCPVLLTTHSDAVFNYLTDPAKAVRVCEIGADHETVIREIDPSAPRGVARYVQRQARRLASCRPPARRVSTGGADRHRRGTGHEHGG